MHHGNDCFVPENRSLSGAGPTDDYAPIPAVGAGGLIRPAVDRAACAPSYRRAPR